MDTKEYIKRKTTEAAKGARALAKAASRQKDDALLIMADKLRNNRTLLISENEKDIEKAWDKGLSAAMTDRLRLNDKRIDEMALGLEEVSKMTDPVGEIINMWTRPNGMSVGRMRVPIGTICIIYESRPNVTADATGLCLKAGNAVILRGGSEAVNSNKAIVDILKKSVSEAGIDEGSITFIDNPDRAVITELLKLEGEIDLVIPRGGEGLIRNVTENSRIPVLKHYKGVCHVYVDGEADLKMAEDIAFNSKVQRPGTCNAMETLLVDREISDRFLPSMIRRFQENGVEVRACSETLKIYPKLKELSEKDYYNEYLSLIVNIKVVQGIDEAIDHINLYSSAHTDTIVTGNYSRSMRFLHEVDSSAVIINASTRLNDGGQFGLGAEIGISTDKIHARGPMGIEELTCKKFIVLGDGQLRE